MKNHYFTEEYRSFRELATSMTLGISNNPIYDAFMRRIEKLALRKGKALDVGAGIGLLSDRLIVNGRFDFVVGADFIYPHPTLRHIPWVRCDLNVDLPFSNEQFDFIFCAEVIEHLENPWGLARDLYRLLKDNGVLLLSTPNNESIRNYLSLLLRGYYTDFNPSSYPVHITPFLRVDLMRILTAVGFSQMRIHYTDVGAIPKIRRLKWQHLGGDWIFKGRLFSDNLLIEARRILKVAE